MPPSRILKLQMWTPENPNGACRLACGLDSLTFFCVRPLPAESTSSHSLSYNSPARSTAKHEQDWKGSFYEAPVTAVLPVSANRVSTTTRR
jgi:hypothetical protein